MLDHDQIRLLDCISVEQFFLDLINNIYNFMQWPGVVLLMTIESACVPIPSEIIMPLAGWVLIKDMGLSPAFTLLAGVYGAVGCTIGSIVAYWVGKKGGRPLLDRYGRYLLITRHDLDSADRWFKKYGSQSAFFSRLIPVIRTFISLPAGIARTNFPKFVIYTFTGSFIWCALLAFFGYQLGAYWEDIRRVIRPFDYVIIGIVALLIAYYIYRHIRRYRKENKPA